MMSICLRDSRGIALKERARPDLKAKRKRRVQERHFRVNICICDCFKLVSARTVSDTDDLDPVFLRRQKPTKTDTRIFFEEYISKKITFQAQSLKERVRSVAFPAASLIHSEHFDKTSLSASLKFS